MKQGQVKEMRSSTRICCETTGRYKPFVSASPNAKETFSGVKSVNISKGGVCIKAPRAIADDKFVILEMETGEGKKLRAYCEVKWVRETGEELAEAGLSFFTMKIDDRDLLNNFLSAKNKEN